MRIACLQFSPQVGDIDNNLNRADSILSRVDPQHLDLLVLPELAFTGYNFKSLQEISPFLEPPGSGITSLWSRTTALKYDCTVVSGYPEKVDPTLKWPTDPEYYNAALVVSPDGETAANYRKSHLYYTDETWALEGQGFFAGRLPGLGKTAIGICMDINPYKFQVPWQNFEFAYHVLDNSTRLVIVSMAWITQEDPEVYTQTPDEPDMDTLTYWLARLDPVIRSEPDHEIIVVFANRCGQEEGATYAGTSAVVGIKGTDVKVYGILGRGQKDLLVVDTDDPPYAKLVYRPTEKVASEEEEPTSSPTSSLSESASHQAAEKSQDILEDTSGYSAAATSAKACNGNGLALRQHTTDASSPVRQEIMAPVKPDRRSVLVEFSPISDNRGFFDEEGSSITPTYEEQYYWPAPVSRAAHRRYHSTSSLGRVTDPTGARRFKTLHNRSSVGSALSDKAPSNRTAHWVSNSSLSIRNHGGHGPEVSRSALSMLEAVQYGPQSPLCTEYTVDEFVAGDLGALSLNGSRQHDSSRYMRSSKSSPLKDTGGARIRETHSTSNNSRYGGKDPVVADSHDDHAAGQSKEHTHVEEWLSKSSSPSNLTATRSERSSSSGMKRTKARKERPAYINDWDEPRSYSPMEFRTPRAMTFEEIGALTTPVST